MKFTENEWTRILPDAPARVPGGCGLVLLADCPQNAGARRQTADTPLRDQLFSEGFLRMGWPAYDPALVARTDRGKPVYAADLPYFFNFSDTKEFAAAAFAGCPVGIDIEQPRTVRDALRRSLHPREQEYLDSAVSRDDCTRRFLRLWTAKEAFAKMTGEGMTREILAASFLPSDQDPGPAALIHSVSGELTLCVCTEKEMPFYIAFFTQLR